VSCSDPRSTLKSSINTALIFYTADKERRKGKKEKTLRKKLDNERKKVEKNEFGTNVINASDAGEKRSRRDIEVADENTENESEPPAQSANNTAAYNRENKVPVEHLVAAPKKKKRASPPQQGHVLSARDIQDRFPDIDVSNSDNGSNDENDEVGMIRSDDVVLYVKYF
jgi:hypothetical protein